MRASLDTDGDGKVSAAEFAAGMRRLRKEAAARAREKYGKQQGLSGTVAYASVWAIAFVTFLTLAVGAIATSSAMDARVVREDIMLGWWLAMGMQWLLLEPAIVLLLLGFELGLKKCSTFGAAPGET